MKKFIPKVGGKMPRGLGDILDYDNKNNRVLVNRGVGYQPFVVWTIDGEGNAYNGRYYKTLQGAVNRLNNYYDEPKKKNPTKKKHATKKRTTKKYPKGTQKDHLWIIFLCRGRSISFVKFGSTSRFGFASKKGDATLFQTKSEALRIAKSAANSPRGIGAKVGVTPFSTTPAEIKKKCRTPGKK